MALPGNVSFSLHKIQGNEGEKGQERKGWPLVLESAVVLMVSLRGAPSSNPTFLPQKALNGTKSIGLKTQNGVVTGSNKAGS